MNGTDLESDYKLVSQNITAMLSAILLLKDMKLKKNKKKAVWKIFFRVQKIGYRIIFLKSLICYN